MKKVWFVVLISVFVLIITSCDFNVYSTANETINYSEVNGMPLLEFLNNNISSDNTIDEIVDVFEEMCKTPVEDDLLLLEYGTYNFTGEKLFYFDLVRQYPDGDGEYYQLRVSVTYAPDKENRKLYGSLWSDETKEDFFDYIRKSAGYKYANGNQNKSVEIRIDHT